MGMNEHPDLAGYLSRRYGGPGGLIVRDPVSPTGLREWSDEDTAGVISWLEGGLSREPTCLNLRQTADSLGVSIHTAQTLMRRESEPLPHMRKGRRIIVPAFLLTQWMEDEVRRQSRPGVVEGAAATV